MNDGRFLLQVTDDGPGVDDAQWARPTERSFRGDEARTRVPSGSGLGLHIVSGVARRHGFALEFARPAAGGLRASLSGPAR